MWSAAASSGATFAAVAGGTAVALLCRRSGHTTARAVAAAMQASTTSTPPTDAPAPSPRPSGSAHTDDGIASGVAAADGSGTRSFAGAGSGSGAGSAAASAPVVTSGSRARALHVCVYKGSGAEDGALATSATVAALQRVVDPAQHLVHTIGATELQFHSWDEHTALLVLPDGRAGAYDGDEALGSDNARRAVQRLLSHGGAVLGICSGAKACVDTLHAADVAVATTPVEGGGTVELTAGAAAFCRSAQYSFGPSNRLVHEVPRAVGSGAPEGGDGAATEVALLGVNIETRPLALSYSHPDAAARLGETASATTALLCGVLSRAGVAVKAGHAAADGADDDAASMTAYMVGSKRVVDAWSVAFQKGSSTFAEWGRSIGVRKAPPAVATAPVQRGHKVHVGMFDTAEDASVAAAAVRVADEEAVLAANATPGSDASALSPTQAVLVVPCRGTQPTGTAFDWDAYLEALDTRVLGRTLLYADVMGSTQSTLDGNIGLLRSIDPAWGVAVVAARQTAGRGRQHNKWISPPGSVSVTAHLAVHASQLAHTVFLQYACPLAVVDGIRSLGGGYEDLDLRVKWPNDIYYRDSATSLHKLGGVLVTTTNVGRGFRVGVGCGINVSNSKPAVCLNSVIAEHNATHPHAPPLAPLKPEQVLAVFLTRFEGLSELVLEGGFGAIEELYYRYWLHSNAKVTIEADSVTGASAAAAGATAGVEESKRSGSITATVVGVDSSDGCLVAVEDDSGDKVRLMPGSNMFDVTRNLIRRKR